MNGPREGLKKVFIKTYGCQMNVYDSERMTDALAPSGYVPVKTADCADLILLNTCHIREKAAEKVYSELGRLRRIKERAARKGRPVIVGVAGCVAQAEGVEIVRRAPVVDLVVGPQSYHRLPELLAETRPGKPVIETELAVADKFAMLARQGRVGRAAAVSEEDGLRPDPERRAQVAAYITVQEGCDKFCTFCVVPYTRGAEISRSSEAIVAEATRLAGAGVRELTLLGQNVNAWHGAGPGGSEWGLGQLLFRLAEIPGIDRLRYTTSHPKDMDDGLIAAHRDLAALMPYLHLPAQSGCDRILAAMNRRHTRSDYLRLIDRIRAARPDIAIAGDFIVGFPGETETDFAETMSVVDAVGYASAFSFKYSPRPGTRAATADGQVPEPVKTERLARLQVLINRRQSAFIQSKVGTLAEVLFERRGRHPGQIVGRSPWLLPIQVEADAALIGTIGRVVIDAAGANSLNGTMIGAAAARSPATAQAAT